MNKLIKRLAVLSVGLTMAIGAGVAAFGHGKGEVNNVVMAAEDDSHSIDDFTGKGTGVVINNGTTPDTIELADQGYPVKQVVIGWKHNKSNDGVTATVTVGGDELGSGKVGGQNATTTTTIGDGSLSLSGAITISFSNSMTGTGKGTLYLNTLTLIEGYSGSARTLESITLSGELTKTSYFRNDSPSAAGLVVTANYDDDSHSEVTSSATITANPATLSTSGSVDVTFTATYQGKSDQVVKTVTVGHAGDAEDPFTVAEALAKANEIGAVGNSGQGPWVTKGIITRVTSAPVASYWNATYFISDTGEETNELQVYRGFYLNGAKFDDTTKLLLKAGNIVTITGNLTGSYGCEYCANNYLLSIEEPETGDIEVTFEPASTSFEIGATGTFTATADMEGCTFAWESNNEDVLSVDENTGAFEALALGTAKITVTATKGDKEGVAFVNMTVNGAAGSPLTVAEAVTLAASLDSGKTTSYYVYVEGYVKEFATSMKDSKPRAFDIMSGDEASRIMVYTNVDPYTDFVSDLALGHYVKVKANVQNYSGTYELTSPEKISSAYSALSLAYELLSLTDEFCEGYDDVTDNKSLVVSAWETLSGATKYGSLSAAEIAKLVEADAKEESKGGTILEQAMARYDYLNDKYELEGFIEGRGGSGSVENRVEINNNNSLIVVIAVISAVSLVALSTLLVLKKKHK